MALSPTIEVLADLVGQLRDAGYRDRYGHPVENNVAYQAAVRVLTDRPKAEVRSFQPAQVREDGSRH